jgi:hypothetical protein
MSHVGAKPNPLYGTVCDPVYSARHADSPRCVSRETVQTACPARFTWNNSFGYYAGLSDRQVACIRPSVPPRPIRRLCHPPKTVSVPPAPASFGRPTPGRPIAIRLHVPPFRSSAVQVFRRSGFSAVQVFPLFRFSAVQVFRCSGFPLFRFSAVQVFRCSGSPPFRFPALQVLRLWAFPPLPHPSPLVYSRASH